MIHYQYDLWIEILLESKLVNLMCYSMVKPYVIIHSQMSRMGEMAKTNIFLPCNKVK